jgi:sugar/nucleoside kinase (ribokinase family)
VLGDLVLDVVLAPRQPPERGTDVPGRVAIHQGGSAANTARWLARLRVSTQLVASVGRDAAGRALIEAIRGDGVTPRITRAAGAPTGRIGVLVEPGGERSFVADRGAADALRPSDLRADWFKDAGLLHLPAYSLLGEPLGLAGREAVHLARAGGALISLDLASIGPLMTGGREAALELVRGVAPDLLFATAVELHGLLGAGGRTDARALALAPVVVVKRGSAGATVLVRDDPPGPSARPSPASGVGASIRFDVATRPMAAADTTGAGDAFDAGFIAEWLASRAAGRSPVDALRRAATAGNRIAGRQVTSPRRELQLG